MRFSIHGRIGLALLVLVALVSATGCRRATARQGELLPGRSRPTLEHGWTHPRDLQFGANAFQPPDVKAALSTTPAGLRAYVVPSDGETLAQIVAAIPLGPADERADETGAAALIAQLLQQDVEQRLGDGFVGRLSVEQDPDLTRVTVQTFADEWRDALAAVVGGLREVRLDPAAIDGYRTGPGFARTTRNLGGSGFRPAVEIALMTARPPVAPPRPGLSVRREAVAALASRSIGPQSIVFGIGGGVTRAVVDTALNELSAGWTGPAPAADRRQALSSQSSGEAQSGSSERFLAEHEPGFTTWLAIGHPIPALTPADEAPVAVMAQIVNIRLNIAIREIRGLANQTVLQVPATTAVPGLLHVRSGARPESIAPIVRYVEEELKRIREPSGQPAVEELEQAKGGLVLSQWQRSLDGARAASATLAIETVRHGSLDRLLRWPDTVRAVTADDVRGVASRYIHPDKLVTVIVGQIDALRTARHPRWPDTLEQLKHE